MVLKNKRMRVFLLWFLLCVTCTDLFCSCFAPVKSSKITLLQHRACTGLSARSWCHINAGAQANRSTSCQAPWPGQCPSGAHEARQQASTGWGDTQEPSLSLPPLSFPASLSPAGVAHRTGWAALVCACSTPALPQRCAHSLQERLWERWAASICLPYTENAFLNWTAATLHICTQTVSPTHPHSTLNTMNVHWITHGSALSTQTF